MSSKHPGSVSRRSVVAAGLVGGVGLALGSPLALAAVKASSLPSIVKTIPSSGEKLPVVGVGTNQYSVTASDEIAARREVLEHLPILGGKVVDTAWRYGDSEIVIGNLVKQLGNRDKLFIATKTPTPGEGPTGAAALELGLTRLQMQKIDLLQIHSFRGTEELFPVLVDAKKAGKIRYIGVTTSTDEQYPQMVEALQKRPLDFIQVDYSIENQGAESILQLAKDKGVAVLINVPLGGRDGRERYRTARWPRRQPAVESEGQTIAGLGRRNRRRELAATFAEVHDCAPGSHGGDSRHHEARAPGRQPACRPRPSA